MSTVRVEPGETSEATFTSTRPLDYAPGVLLLVTVGVLAKYTQIWWNALPDKNIGPYATLNMCYGRS